MRPTQALGRVERALQPVVCAVERLVVAMPHLETDTKRFFEALEPLAERRERDPKPQALLGIPTSADAKKRAAAGQHVQRRNDLRQQPRVAVMHARDQRTELDLSGLACE